MWFTRRVREGRAKRVIKTPGTKKFVVKKQKKHNKYC